MHLSLLRRAAAAMTALAVMAGLAGLAAVSPAAADEILPRFKAAHTKLSVSDGLPEDQLGNAVAIDGDTALVGAFLADVDGVVNQGAAYVYTRTDDGWARQATLTADEDDIGLLFGRSVAVSGDTAVIGATGSFVDGSRPGAAFVFVRDGDEWTQQARLTADGLQWGAEFGASVAVDGDTALVGAQYAHVGDTNVQGVAYAFSRDGEAWSEQAKLVASDGTFYNYFGTSVGLDADTAVIGAPGATVNGKFRRGAAYVFSRTADGWAEETKLDPSDGAAEIEFGAGVDIDGETILVGAGGPELTGFDVRGAGYVFTRSGDTWAEQAKLTPIDGQPEDRFGRSVALDAGTAVLGATHHGAQTGIDLEQGTAVVFTYADGDWTELVMLTTSDIAPGDHLGSAVAIDGNDVLAGAPNARVGDHRDQGAAYAFSTSERALQPPRIGIEPGGLAALLTPDDTTTARLRIANAGEADLRWEVTGAGGPAGVLRPAGEATVVETLEEAAPATGTHVMAADDTPAHAGAGDDLASAGDDLAPDESVSALTHSASMDIVPGNTLACARREDGTTREYHGLRTFTLPDFGVDGAFDVTEVTFGVESISQPADLTVSLHTLDGPFTYLNLRRLASAVVTVEPDDAGLVTVPIDTQVPAGATLVMEVVAPDMEGIGTIYLGSNSAGETAPSYTSSVPCGSPDPVTYESLGGPHVHLVMAVHGTSVEPLSCELPDWLAVAPDSGTAAPGEESTVEVSMDAAGLEIGEYTAHLCISSNDPATPMVATPVSLTVDDDPPGGITLTAHSRHDRGVWYTDLAWTGTESDTVDVYRDDDLIATVPNAGDPGDVQYTDRLGRIKKGAAFTYQLCETGADTCSDSLTIKPRG